MRRAFSLVEMIAVLAILGLVVAAAAGRFGGDTLENLEAEAYVRRLALDLAHARRATIATGDNHYLAVTTSAGKATEYVLMRRAGGGDVAVDETRSTPSGVAVTASAAELEFDFDGSSLAGYSVAVAGPSRSWSLATIAATGTVEIVDTTP